MTPHRWAQVRRDWPENGISVWDFSCEGCGRLVLTARSDWTPLSDPEAGVPEDCDESLVKAVLES